jgi:hypothetical protein
MDSEKVAVVKKGEEVEGLEEVTLAESGVKRVRIGEGKWVSERSGKGALILMERQLAMLAELDNGKYAPMAVKDRRSAAGGDGMTVRVKIKGWSKKDQLTAIDCTDELHDQLARAAEGTEGAEGSVAIAELPLRGVGLVSRRQVLNEAALLLQALCRGRAQSRAALVACQEQLHAIEARKRQEEQRKANVRSAHAVRSVARTSGVYIFACDLRDCVCYLDLL